MLNHYNLKAYYKIEDNNYVIIIYSGEHNNIYSATFNDYKLFTHVYHTLTGQRPQSYTSGYKFVLNYTDYFQPRKPLFGVFNDVNARILISLTNI